MQPRASWRPVASSIHRPMAGRGGEDDGQVGFDRVALVVSLVGQEPDGALRVQAARLGEPGLAETVRGVGLEISRASHDYDEARGVRGGSGTHYLTAGSRPAKPVPWAAVPLAAALAREIAPGPVRLTVTGAACAGVGSWR